MEVTKRTYQKHKTNYKLSIKHYTNSNIKEFNIWGVEIYPIYVEVTFKRKTTRFRSKLPSSNIEIQKQEGETIDWINPYRKDELLSDEHCEVGEIIDFDLALERDYRLIESIVNYQRSIKEETFSIVDLPRLYHTSYHELSFFVDWCLKQEIQENLCELNNIDDLDKEHTEYHRDFLFPIVYDTSSLNNLEYYLSRYPDLISLKQKYNSQTWIFDFYLGIMRRNDLIDTYWKLGGFQNMYADYDIEITLLDFKERYFQSTFLMCFQHEPFVQDVLSDVELLFTKYFDSFNEQFMK